MSADRWVLVPGWAIESGVGGFSEKGDRWVCVRHLESQCGQDFYEDRDPLIFGFLSALAAAPAAPAAEPVALTDEQAAELLGFVRGVHFDAPGLSLSDFSQWNKDRMRLVQLGWNAAHGIGAPHD